MSCERPCRGGKRWLGIPVWWSAGLLLAASSLTSLARAEETALEAALAAYGQGELDVALSRFEALAAEPHHDRSALIDISLHLGVLYGALRDQERSQWAFEAALCLDPSLEPPQELGGDSRALFRRLQQDRRAHPFGLQLRSAPEEARGEGAGDVVQISVLNSPPGLVAVLRWRLERLDGSPEPGTEGRVEGDGPAQVTLPPASVVQSSQPLVLVAQALNGAGAVLVSRGVELGLLRGRPELDDLQVAGASSALPGGEGGERPAASRRRRWYRHPLLWVTVGLVVAGGVATGIVLGLRQDGPPTPDPEPTTYTFGAPTMSVVLAEGSP